VILYRREEDFSNLGRAVMRKAQEIVQAKHLEGEFAPSLEDAIQEASRIVCVELVKTAQKNSGGKKWKRKKR
jgi:hypothetical protein